MPARSCVCVSARVRGPDVFVIRTTIVVEFAKVAKKAENCVRVIADVEVFAYFVDYSCSKKGGLSRKLQVVSYTSV